MKSQPQQAENENRKNLVAEGTSAANGEGQKKRRERFAGWLGDSPGVQLVSFASQAAAIITVIVAAVTYFVESGERTKQKYYQAWQVINIAQGQGGSGGRIDALQDLNEAKQSLVGLDVANAFLKGIDLEGAELDNANFTNTTLNGADLRDASLENAIFTEATLTNADLRDASLKNANLQGAILGDAVSGDTGTANLQDANLESADLREANLANVNYQGANLNDAELYDAVLDEAQLQGAELKGVVLQKASLRGAKLQGADFRNASLTYTDISGTDLRGAKHLTQKQINSSLGDDETQLPEGLQASPTWYSSPLDELGPLPPREYTVDVFDAPMSFRLGEGWINGAAESDTLINLLRQNTQFGILFVAPDRVYDPQELSSGKIRDSPKDMVAWLMDHKYLQPINEPVEVDVGGVTGTQFDVQVESVGQNYSLDLCDQGPCVPLFVQDPWGTPIRVYEGEYQMIVLEVQGLWVVIINHLQEVPPTIANEVLKTIEWNGVATSTSAAAPDNAVGSRSQEREMKQSLNIADLEAEAEEAASDYYKAAGLEDWAYTYEHLDSKTQSMFTEKEWFNKNQWFAETSTVIYHILSVDVRSATQEPVAEVTLKLTYDDNSTTTRNTLFVFEDGVWKHRFMEDEITLFRPDASYEEFVAKR